MLYFLCGVIGGISFINHANSMQTEEIFSYVNSLRENIKSSDEINKTVILMQSMKQNIIFILLIWFLGCTILGSFLIYVAILYKGFSIGYTVSAIIATLGVESGSLFAVLALLLQNIIFLPMIFLLSESGIKLYQNLKQNHYVNIKLEFIRHTIILLITAVIAIVASFIEVYGSTNFLIFFKNFF